MLDLSLLNKPQLEAVKNIDGPLLVLAGAGSGKTRVLTYRIAYLIENGVYPGNILSITFTNKAASEMKERVLQIVGDEAKSMWISTFHSSCVRILRQDIDKLKLGYDRNFAIYDSSDQEKIVDECLKELNFDTKVYKPKEMIGKIGRLKDNLIDHNDYYKTYCDDYKNRVLARCYHLYQEKLRGNNALDFDDIINKTVELFNKEPSILSYYQRKFRYILIDEYQDTNRAQYQFVNLLAREHKNLCVVGDDDQSIYTFRGADIRNILEFEKDYPNVKVIKLEQNYRSTKKILSAANRVISNNEKRKVKNLWTENAQGEDIRLFRASNQYEEAQFIINEILKLKKENVKEFAVLYRTNALSRTLEEAFVKSNMPYKVVGTQRFYDRKEIKDILSYLRVINNPLDSLSLERIINVPKRGIGAATIDKIKEYSGKVEQSMYSTLLDIEDVEEISDRLKKSIAKFVSLLNYFKQLSEEVSVPELINEIYEKIGYISELREDGSDDSLNRLENLEEFKSAAVEFNASNEDKSLAKFLEGIALISDQDSLSQDGSIVLMTIHTAKGLEFDTVFISGMEEGLFPHYSSQENISEMEEERRLCYVGITRAKRALYLTFCNERLLYGRTMYNTMSSFIREIPKELLEEVYRNKGNNYMEHNDMGLKTSRKIERNEVWTEIGHGINDGKNKVHSNFVQIKTEKPKLNLGEVKAGVKVKHSKFGVGTVVEVKEKGKDTTVKIAFDSQGIKNLILEMAPIEIIK